MPKNQAVTVPLSTVPAPATDNRGTKFYVQTNKDAAVEAQLEQRLLDTTLRIYDPRCSPEEAKFFTIGTLEQARSFLFKYQDRIQNKNFLLEIAEAISVINHGELDKDTISEIFQNLRKPLTITLAELGFRVHKTERKPYSLKIMERMQILPNETTDAIFRHSNNSKLKAFCELVEYSIQNENRDAVIIICGDRSSGKTRLMLRMIKIFRELRAEKLNLDTDVYYTTIDGLKNEMLTKTKLIRGIDEGYFAAYNIDTNTRVLKEFLQALNAVRNRGHILIFNLTKLTRGAKGLLETANFYFQKPSLDYALMFIRDREFVGDDPWCIEELMKAKRIGRKRFLMKHNPNYIRTVKVRRLGDEIFSEYETKKRSAQERIGVIEQIMETSKKEEAVILNRLYQGFTATPQLFTFQTLRAHLRTVYGIEEADVDKWVSKFRRYGAGKKLYRQITEEITEEEEEGHE